MTVRSSRPLKVVVGCVPVGGLAVGDDTVAAGKLGEQFVDLVAEGLLIVVAGACSHHTGRFVCSPTNACSIARTGVAPHPGAQEHDRTRSLAEHEVSAWSGDVEDVADGDPIVQVGRAAPSRLTLIR